MTVSIVGTSINSTILRIYVTIKLHFNMGVVSKVSYTLFILIGVLVGRSGILRTFFSGVMTAI